jgi:hypothetical protein
LRTRREDRGSAITMPAQRRAWTWAPRSRVLP